jgi:hypothetical protein
MKTISINIYSFNELTETAKENAINNQRENICTDYIYDDAHETVKKFHELFGTKEGSKSWLDINTNNFEYNVTELKGLRLRTYIINNFGYALFKGKYYSLWSKKDVSYKYHKEGYPVLKTRHSKVMFENSSVLTGVCYDESILQPIYDFIEYKNKDYYSYMNIECLMNECINSIEKDIENEIEGVNKEDYIIEDIINRELQFDEYGELI